MSCVCVCVCVCVIVTSELCIDVLLPSEQPGIVRQFDCYIPLLGLGIIWTFKFLDFLRMIGHNPGFFDPFSLSAE